MAPAAPINSQTIALDKTAPAWKYVFATPAFVIAHDSFPMIHAFFLLQLDSVDTTRVLMTCAERDIVC